VNELQDVGMVYLLYINESQRMEIRHQLILHGVPLKNIEWINIPYNSIWTRDYGPQNVWGQESDDWGIVDFFCSYGYWDNNVNPKLHTLWKTDYYSSPLVTEGGNLCPDGMGRVFCTNWILQENPLKSEEEVRQILQEYLGVELFVLPKPPISPHLDMCAKLVDPETWIVGEWPANDPNTPYVDKLVDLLENLTASTGNPYKIYRVQQPDRLKSGYWRTYTNAYMQNGKVLVPIFGVEQDSAALAVYQQALPDWKIIGIDCTVYDHTGGAIHCSTDGIVSHDQVSLLHGVLNTEDVDIQARNSSVTWAAYKSVQVSSGT
jgi:agmatine deiminase